MQKYTKVPVKTTYMEMKTKPEIIIPERKWVSLTLFTEPKISLYKEVYNRVGNDWGWAGRLIISDEELKKIIHHPDNLFYCLFNKDELVGFFELRKQSPDNVEIVYLGLVPEYIGKGFGKLLLNLSIITAWETNPKRIWLHTCEYDHKNALKVYEKAGFKKYKEAVENEYYSPEFLKKLEL